MTRFRAFGWVLAPKSSFSRDLIFVQRGFFMMIHGYIYIYIKGDAKY
jgi:hypothetical protein